MIGRIGIKNFIIFIKQKYKSLIPLFIFLFYCVISLFYSIDFNYGFAKIFSFLIYLIPAILVFSNSKSELLSIKNINLAYFIIFLGLILAIILFSVYPLEYDVKKGTNTFLFWTHNGLSTYLTFSIIVNFFILKNLNLSRKIKNLHLIILFIFVFALVLVAKRILIYSFIILFISYFISYLIKYKKLNYLYTKILGIILISFIIVYMFPNKFNSSIERYNVAQSISKEIISNDYSLGPRVRAYKTSIKSISDNPVFGIGLGGYNAITESKISMKYPHNIILEVAVELGLVGLFMFLFILIKQFKNLFKLNLDLFAIACLYLIVSLTGGDLSSHKILYLLLFI